MHPRCPIIRNRNFCHCKTMHAWTHQPLGLSSEGVLGQAVGGADIAASCLLRYYCIFLSEQII